MIARRIIVTGRVQGVFYRQWTIDTARSLGLDGWVRNRSDGSVEIVASGTQAMVDKLIEACRKGPPAAQVERVAVRDLDEGVASGFVKKPTI